MLCRRFGQQLVTEPVVRAGIRLTFEASAFGQSVQEPYEDWIRTMTALARKAQEESEMARTLDAETFARYLVASFTGVQMVSEIMTGRQDVMERITDMWHVLLPAVVAGPPENQAQFLDIASRDYGAELTSPPKN